MGKHSLGPPLQEIILIMLRKHGTETEDLMIELAMRPLAAIVLTS